MTPPTVGMLAFTIRAFSSFSSRILARKRLSSSSFRAKSSMRCSFFAAGWMSMNGGGYICRLAPSSFFAFSASFSFSSPLPSSSMGTGSPSFASFFSSSGFLVAASFSFASSFFSAFSFFSASFFAAAAFAAATFAAATFFSASFLAARCAHAAFQATCLARQRCSVFCHLARCCFAQSDGTIPSTRRALFLLRTHAFTYSCAFWALLHSYLISSKPSSFSGRLNSPRDSLSF
mmetsp:Transcript_78788/g.245420  ORF Transcript_78788/g.245420 Transcript_78788/m.245420 type:complete len:233 (-) Transcript_78788:110-808(-)